MSSRGGTAPRPCTPTTRRRRGDRLAGRGYGARSLPEHCKGLAARFAGLVPARVEGLDCTVDHESTVRRWARWHGFPLLRGTTKCGRNYFCSVRTQHAVTAWLMSRPANGYPMRVFRSPPAAPTLPVPPRSQNRIGRYNSISAVSRTGMSVPLVALAVSSSTQSTWKYSRAGGNEWAQLANGSG